LFLVALAVPSLATAHFGFQWWQRWTPLGPVQDASFASAVVEDAKLTTITIDGATRTRTKVYFTGVTLTDPVVVSASAQTIDIPQISLTDSTATHTLVVDPPAATLVQTFRGWFFVASTTATVDGTSMPVTLIGRIESRGGNYVLRSEIFGADSSTVGTATVYRVVRLEVEGSTTPGP
jgi:hypothetical protein